MTLMQTYARHEPQFVRGQGAFLFNADGAPWLDLLSGIGVNALGHAHPELVKALQAQAGQLLHTSNLYRTTSGEHLAERLCQLTGMAEVFFSNSGSEANECALKWARKTQQLAGQAQRTGFVALQGGFHGRTFGALSVTSNPAYRAPFGPALDAEFVPPNDLAALEQALTTQPAACIMEPLQGEGGLRTLSTTYLRAAREACTRTGTLLIHDEVQCGVGRTGTFLAADFTQGKPDAVTLAKPLGAGIPIGATLVSDSFAGTLVPGDHGSTFGGGPLAMCAAHVVLDAWGSGLQDQVRMLGTHLTERLDAIVEAHAGVHGRRGRGLMQGLVIPGRAQSIAAALFEAHVLVGTATPDVLRLLPPYILSPVDLDAGLATIDRILNEQLQ
jgi:acetylornithine/N-succinyldiaminopimelate aminotransferase